MVRGPVRTTAALALAVGLAIGAPGCGKRALEGGEDAGGVGPVGGHGGSGLPVGSGGAGGAGAGTGVAGAVGPGTGGAGGGAPNDGGAGAGGSITPPIGCGIPVTPQLPRLTNQQYDRTLRDLLGVTQVAAFAGGPPSAVLRPDHAGDLSRTDWDGYVAASEAIAAQVMADANLRRRFMACEPTGDGAACLRDTIVAFGRRAFRRPLRTDEVARFEKIVSQRATLTATGAATEIAEVLLQAFLVSPSFLQRSEIAATPGGAPLRFMLSPHEVASRLSYMLWGSTPDETLDRAADAGALVTADQIRVQAQRMTRDPRAREVVGAFHRAYLRAGPGTPWTTATRDPARFPGFSNAVVAAMNAETDLVADAVAFDDRGSFQDLLSTTRGFVNWDTAALYGLDPSIYGTNLQAVTLDARRRPGILTRVGFLIAHAYRDRTAPIARGAFVSNAILGRDLPAVHPSPLPAPPDGMYPTNRARVEAETRTAEPVCASCHASYINPPGFVLEAYDALGRWQTTEADTGAPIDTAAQVMIDGATVTVRDPADLMARLADSTDAQRTYARRWVGYAYGREANPLDGCVVEALLTDIRQVRLPILDILVGLTQPESFRVRAREATP